MQGEEEQLKNLNRTLDQVAASLKSMTRVMEAMNINLVEFIKVISFEEEVKPIAVEKDSSECVICGPGYKYGSDGCNHTYPGV